MQHIEVIQFIRDFFNHQGFVILPSTSRNDYESFSDWEIGCKKHVELSAIYDVLREFFQSKKVIYTESFRNTELSSEQKTAKVLSLIEDYKIQRIIIRGTGQEIHLDW
jgi:hypothetical protein